MMFYGVTVMWLWLGLDTKTTWLGLGKDHGLGVNDHLKHCLYFLKVMHPSSSGQQ